MWLSFAGVDEDFELWSLRLSAALKGKDLADVVYDPVQDPGAGQEEDHANYQRRGCKAKEIISTSLGDKPLRLVQSASYTS